MKLLQHKHKFVCRNEIQMQWDENNKNEYVVLDCICNNCEIAGKSRAFPVSKLSRGLAEGLEIFLSQPMDPYAESRTRNSPEFWERDIEVAGKKE